MPSTMFSFQNLHQPTKNTIRLQEEDYLFFGGTAYLGLLADPDYIALYKAGIDIYGLNNGTSRSNNIQLGIYAEAESYLANRFGFEAAALLSSGYLAAQVTVRSLCEDAEIYYTPDCHPSLWISESSEVEGSDFNHWVKQTVKRINDSSKNRFVVISNAIDNLKPQLYDFSEFSGISNDKEVIFVLDDSHGIGIVKSNKVSADLSFSEGKDNISVVVLASLAKGLGTDAGVVMASKTIISKIRKHPIFNGASPSAPATLYALMNGNEIYSKALDKLQANIAFFEQAISSSFRFNHAANFPVFSCLDSHLYQHLLKNKILISSFPYPLPHSKLLNRLVISALHSESELSHLIDVCLSKNEPNL